MLFDIDHLSSWRGPLECELSDLLPPNIQDIIRDTQSRYLEDAGEIVLEAGDISAVSKRIVHWLANQSVAAFHGTRLGPEAIRNIQKHGLKKLNPNDRLAGLELALRGHQDWQRNGHLLPDLLTQFGNGKHGKREGQVHFCVSRAELLTGCNHYLVEGSEIDSNVARMAFGNEGLELVKRGRKPILIQVAIPGAQALQGLNPFGFDADVPNIVREIINRWAFQVADPNWDPTSTPATQALMFFEDIPADWIRSIETVPEELLMPHYRHPDPMMRAVREDG